MALILNFILRPKTPTQAEFEEICPDGGTIPDCEIRVEPDYRGAPEPLESYGDLEVVNCPMESLTANCGASVSVWMQPGCSPDTPEVVCDDVQNPVDIDPNSSETIYILDGEPPYVWEIESGYGYSLQFDATEDLGGRPDERKNSQNTLYSSFNSCGTVNVKITDNCQTELICDFPSSAASDLEYDWENSGQTIEQLDSTLVAVKGGVPPYSWSITGDGFSVAYNEGGLTNTVLTTSEACGSAVITVIDTCGDETTGSIRCTSGQWVLRETGENAINSFAGMGVDTIGSYCLETVRGAWKAEETLHSTASGAVTYAFCEARCNNYLPNGCVSVLTGSWLECSYIGGTVVTCPPPHDQGWPLCCHPSRQCTAIHNRFLYEWVCL